MRQLFFSAKTGNILEWDFAKQGERIQIALPGTIAVNNSDAYMAAGLSGLGVMQAATFALQQHLDAGRLELLLTEWCTDPLPLHVVYPQNRHLSAKVRAFVEWIAELFYRFSGTANRSAEAGRQIIGIRRGQRKLARCQIVALAGATVTRQRTTILPSRTCYPLPVTRYRCAVLTGHRIDISTARPSNPASHRPISSGASPCAAINAC
ncbi:LysR substrate-binding domain-containing protein [Undibacterium arcticum]